MHELNIRREAFGLHVICNSLGATEVGVQLLGRQFTLGTLEHVVNLLGYVEELRSVRVYNDPFSLDA